MLLISMLFLATAVEARPGGGGRLLAKNELTTCKNDFMACKGMKCKTAFKVCKKKRCA